MSNQKMEQLIQQVASELELDPHLVHQVVQHQFKATKQAMELYPSVELPRLFYYKQKPWALLRRIEKYLYILSPEYPKPISNPEVTQHKLEKLLDKIELYDKLYPGDIRSLKERNYTPKAFAELDKRGFKPAEGNM